MIDQNAKRVQSDEIRKRNSNQSFATMIPVHKVNSVAIEVCRKSQAPDATKVSKFI